MGGGERHLRAGRGDPGGRSCRGVIWQGWSQEVGSRLRRVCGRPTGCGWVDRVRVAIIRSGSGRRRIGTIRKRGRLTGVRWDGVVRNVRRGWRWISRWHPRGCRGHVLGRIGVRVSGRKCSGGRHVRCCGGMAGSCRNPWRGRRHRRLRCRLHGRAGRCGLLAGTEFRVAGGSRSGGVRRGAVRGCGGDDGRLDSRGGRRGRVLRWGG